jgi:hypothetical protein
MGNPKTDGIALVQAHVSAEVRDWVQETADTEGISRSDVLRRILYRAFRQFRARRKAARERSV